MADEQRPEQQRPKEQRPEELADATRLQPHLEAGESFLAAARSGADLRWEPPRPDRRGGLSRMVDAIFWPDWPQRLADRVAHGSTHHAPDGSTALSYLQAEHNFAWTSQRLLPVTRFYAVLTDRRLIRFGSKINQDIIGIAWSCPRSMVARADVGARWLSFGRLRITFADGSWVLLADINDLGRRRAKAFAAAINS